ncbi:hypothetical protein HNQ91_003999 [Filimonas zeae]|uniref:Uncharacterized protein n=1 Tax=Filimonas zeae TaxID=1737353 RepID=A0A917J2H6_9BACT|nr:hypothetical protein [Filimonas zeae]MDR6340926.1 hypothetical protein [Filimonas zeae]GGH77918.1 hypothetical protein GCM10011379_44990 [Filimonas zeae]
MKQLKIKPVFWIVCAIGLLAAWLEWKPVHVVDFGLETWLRLLSMGLLYLLAIVVLFLNVRRYVNKEGKRSFLPFCAAIGFIGLVWGHRLLLAGLDGLPNAYVAVNLEIGAGDGGLSLVFKEGNWVKVLQQNTPAFAESWGTYEQHGDTLIIQADTGFHLGRSAVMEKSQLRFIDSGVVFSLAADKP